MLGGTDFRWSSAPPSSWATIINPAMDYNSNTSSFSYDMKNNKTEATDPNIQTSATRYDASNFDKTDAEWQHIAAQVKATKAFLDRLTPLATVLR